MIEFFYWAISEDACHMSFSRGYSSLLTDQRHRAHDDSPIRPLLVITAAGTETLTSHPPKRISVPNDTGWMEDFFCQIQQTVVLNGATEWWRWTDKYFPSICIEKYLLHQPLCFHVLIKLGLHWSNCAVQGKQGHLKTHSGRLFRTKQHIKLDLKNDIANCDTENGAHRCLKRQQLHISWNYYSMVNNSSYQLN